MNEQEQALFSVKGFCMWPFLKDGQKVLVKKITGKDFRTGDLLLYRGDGHLFCHRLLRKEEKGGNWVFYCRPDSSVSQGEPINQNMVEGKVAAVISADKVVNLETPLQRFRAIIILLLLSPVLAHFDQLYKRIKGR
jgi:hypothetical protein